MHVFDGWMLDREFVGRDPTQLVKVDRAIVLTAHWRTDYMQLLILVIILGLIGGSMGLIRVKKIHLSRLIHYKTLKERLKRHDVEEKLARLKEVYQKGEISEEVYKNLSKS